MTKPNIAIIDWEGRGFRVSFDIPDNCNQDDLRDAIAEAVEKCMPEPKPGDVALKAFSEASEAGLWPAWARVEEACREGYVKAEETHSAIELRERLLSALDHTRADSKNPRLTESARIALSATCSRLENILAS